MIPLKPAPHQFCESAGDKEFGKTQGAYEKEGRKRGSKGGGKKERKAERGTKNSVSPLMGLLGLTPDGCV